MRVICTHPNGIVLSLGNRDPEAGQIDHHKIEIPGGPSEVPDAFWAKWLAENAEWGPYKAGIVYAAPETKPEA